MRRSLLSSRRGMSLVEVMIAITVVLVMGVMVSQSLSNSIEYQRILESRDVNIRQARVALSKMKREIEQAYLTPNINAKETIETVFVGMDEDPDKLYFATMAHQRIYRDSRECDQAEVTLWAERAEDEQGQGYVLYHRESQRVDERPDEDGQVFPLAYNVRSFNLRYLDPQDNEWRDDWDTRGSDTPYRLPRSVEIGLVLIAEDPDDDRRTVDVPFMTTVLLHYGGRLLNTSNPMANQGGESPFGGSGNPLIPGDQAWMNGTWGGWGVGQGFVGAPRAGSRTQSGRSNAGVNSSVGNVRGSAGRPAGAGGKVRVAPGGPR